MEMERIPEAIAGFDYVLRIHPLDAWVLINRRELLQSCASEAMLSLFV